MDVTQRTQVQKGLQERALAGWLLYDFRRMNPYAHEFLKLSPHLHASRRFAYWIPAVGSPIKLLHAIETEGFSHLEGEVRLYNSWKSWHEGLHALVRGAKGPIAMEYSPECALPALSRVDGGTLELIRSWGVEVVSSGPLLARFTALLSDEEIASHREAARILDETVSSAWEWIARRWKEGVREDEVAAFLAKRLHEEGLIFESLLNCSCGPNSALPHYSPEPGKGKRLEEGDLVLLDLWGKKREGSAVNADITRVAFLGSHPPEEMKTLFNLVRTAQKAAVDFVEPRWSQGKAILGYEVDKAARAVIDKAGYGEAFFHRTGHNIHWDVHGPGTHFDSFETWDDRPLVPRTCYSVEPGIYLPGKFGIRLEHDLLLLEGGALEITGGLQHSLQLLA